MDVTGQLTNESVCLADLQHQTSLDINLFWNKKIG